MLSELKDRLPAGLAQSPVVREVLLFGVIGVVGFLVDYLVLLAVVSLTPSGPILGRIVSLVVAATTTWYLNRRFTFSVAADVAPTVREWLLFCSIQAIGAAFNLFVFSLMLSISGTSPLGLLLAAGVGSLAGMALNFPASKFLVFTKG